MFASEFFVRARVHPNCAIAPGPRLIDSDQLRSGNRRLPGNLIPKINSFTDRGQGRERDKKQSFSNCAQFHRSAAGDGIAAGVPVFVGGTPATFGLNAAGAPGAGVTTTLR